MKPARFGKDDWLAFGLAQLAKSGPDALKVSALCEAANKTIGSFYHHFKDQSAYFDALLAFWKKRNTVDVIDALADVPDTDGKAQHLEIIAMAMDQTEEVGIRMLAQQNATAASTVAEVDGIRIAFMQGLYRDRLGLAEQEALDLAKLEYAAFVGVQTIWPNGSLDDGQTLSAVFQKLVSARYASGSVPR